MSETTLELQIRENSASAIAALDRLSEALGRVGNAVQNGLSFTKVANGIKKITEAMSTAIPEENIAKFERLADSLERLQSVGAVNIKLSSGAQKALQIDSLSGVKDAMDQAKESAQTTTDSTVQMGEAMGDVAPKANEAAEGINNVKKEMKDAAKPIKLFNGGLFSLASSFDRILKYRILRTIIKEITQGFKEGLENVRAYSKAIGGGFSDAMDGADRAILKMKNSLGASLAPILQALIPLFNTLTNAVITAANWINQFVSLLTGATQWTRAVDLSQDLLDKMNSSATGASKSMKNLLADWDELNIIQSQSGGSGSGANRLNTEDYLNMFEEVYKFDQSVKDTVKWVEDHLYVIQGLIAGIAAKLIGLPASLSIAIGGISLGFASGYDIGYHGRNDGNMINSVISLLTATGGGALFGFKVAGVKGAVIGATVTLGLTILASIIGFEKGKQERTWDDMWGDVDLDDEDLKKFAMSQFDFDIISHINIMAVEISNIQQAKQKFGMAANNFRQNYALVKMDIDTSTTAYNELVKSAGEAATAVSELIRQNAVSLAITAKIVPIFGYDEQGNLINITEEALPDITAHYSAMQGAIETLGAELAKWYDIGLERQFTDEEQKIVDQLVARMNRITQAVESAQNYGAFAAASDLALQDLKRGDAQKALEEQNNAIEEYRNNIQETLRLRLEGYRIQEQLAREMAETSLTDEEREKYEADTLYWKGLADELAESMDEQIDLLAKEAADPVALKWHQALEAILGSVNTENYKVKLNMAFEFYTTKEDFEKELIDIIGTEYGLDAEKLKGIGLNPWSFFDVEKLRERSSYMDNEEREQEFLRLLDEIYLGSEEYQQKIKDIVGEDVFLEHKDYYANQRARFAGTDDEFLSVLRDEEEEARKNAEWVEKQNKARERIAHLFGEGYSLRDVKSPFLKQRAGKNTYETADAINEIADAVTNYEKTIEGITEPPTNIQEFNQWLDDEIEKTDEWIKKNEKWLNTPFTLDLSWMNNEEESADAEVEIETPDVVPVEIPLDPYFVLKQSASQAQQENEKMIKEQLHGLFIPDDPYSRMDVENPILKHRMANTPRVIVPVSYNIEWLQTESPNYSFNELYKELEDYDGSGWQNYWADNILPIYKNLAFDQQAVPASRIEDAADDLKELWLQYIDDADFSEEAKEIFENNIYDILTDPNYGKPLEYPYWLINPDDTELLDGLDETAINVEKITNRISGAIQSLNGLGFSFAGGLLGGQIVVTNAGSENTNGNMYTTDSLTGSVGSGIVNWLSGRTTVGENNQQGQAEQNNLIRESNNILRQIAAKDPTIKVTPSSELGAVVRRSEEMYARRTGVSV